MSELIQFELTIPVAPDAELVAAGTTERIATYAGFDEKAMSEIRFAVIEACINAIHHSDSPDQRVYLTFVVEQDKLLVVVRDFGKGFDPTRVVRPRIEEKLKKTPRRGWGLMLIRKLMDKVEIDDISPGTELRMTKYLTPVSPAPATP